MKKGVVLFKSKYGAAGQYAKWLSNELHLPCIDADQVTDQSLDDYDFIVAGGSVYYGKFLLAPFLNKYVSTIKTKKLFLFVVCATPDSSEKEQEKILKENIPATLIDRNNVFFLAGRLAPEKLGFIDRTMLRIAALFEKDTARKKVMKYGIDGVCKDNLIDLFIAIRIHSLIKGNADHKSV